MGSLIGPLLLSPNPAILVDFLTSKLIQTFVHSLAYTFQALLVLILFRKVRQTEEEHVHASHLAYF